MFTILPPPRSRIRGTTARETRNIEATRSCQGHAMARGCPAHYRRDAWRDGAPVLLRVEWRWTPRADLLPTGVSLDPPEPPLAIAEAFVAPDARARREGADVGREHAN